ncbi:unnamed protein product [Trichobilharzia regenti]|nr:unnamed protein product [Trichobilharzia regenti]
MSMNVYVLLIKIYIDVIKNMNVLFLILIIRNLLQIMIMLDDLQKKNERNN